MEKQITMTQKEAMRYDIIKDLINKKIDGTQASIRLNLSIRQTKRIKAKVKKYGIKGVIHGNRGKNSNNKIDEKEKNRIVKIIEENYLDFTSQLSHEKLVENYGITWSYSTTRRMRLEKGFSVLKKRRNKKHFTQRERKKSYGEMIQFDGSYHDWFEGRCIDNGMEEEQCLLLAVDDATGQPVAKICKNESIYEVFGFWKEYIKEYGRPTAIYLDKFSTYKVNHKNAEHDKDFRTQFQRAMTDELGIKVIFANSPQAKGRVERMNSTFQDRLVKELRLANINNIYDANEFIKKEFIPKYSKKFNVQAMKKGNLHIPISKEKREKINNIFSKKTKRIVRNDYVVQYNSRYFQLEEIQKNTTVYKRDDVIVEEHIDGSIYINKNNKYLNFRELPEKPKKEIDVKLPAITKSKSGYVPPINHPWREPLFFKYRQKRKI